MRNSLGDLLMFDTNILLDIICRDRPETSEACKVVSKCNGDGGMGIVAPMSLKDAYYSLNKAYGERVARESVRMLMGLFVIAPIDGETCDRALNSNEPDFEDGLIRACAELNGADVILTRDKKAFKGSRVPAMSCSEYLRWREGNGR